LTGGPADPPDPGDAAKRFALPAFTEEREAAALLFVRKQVPELLPILEKLKTGDARKYQQEICELFQTSEWLSDLRLEDEKRHALEMEVWITETRTLLLVAKLSALKEEERSRHEGELEEYARKLVDLDMQILRLRVEELERELHDAREELSRTEEKREALGKERYDKLIMQARRRGMMK
jgi:hypothetical protein